MARRRAPDKAPVEPDCYTIPEFCQRNRISTQFYYKLRSEGRGPREVRFGSLVRITKEAAAAWRESMTAA
jgi:predicted DNA-binding transcriptional regulator AlpA